MKHLNFCFRLITFDITNTLLRFKLPVGEQYAKVARNYGIQREPDQISTAFFEQWKSMNAIYPNFGCNLGISCYTWWIKLVEKTFYAEGNEISKKQMDALSNHLYAIYKKNVCWEIAPGAISLLQRLKHENIQLGIISNFDERLETVLAAYDLQLYFDFVLASYVVEVAKPSKEIFNLALNKSSVIASEALHVGDDVRLDYQAAKNAGWNAVLLADKLKKGKLSDDIDLSEVVEDIAQLESYIFCT